jgi:hypothetical protein
VGPPLRRRAREERVKQKYYFQRYNMYIPGAADRAEESADRCAGCVAGMKGPYLSSLSQEVLWHF